jgi:hypothetical protein
VSIPSGSRTFAGHNFAIALLFATVTAFGTSLVHFSRSRELLVRHLGWLGILAGFLWWMWLSPSLVGLMMILIGLSVQIRVFSGSKPSGADSTTVSEGLNSKSRGLEI